MAVPGHKCGKCEFCGKEFGDDLSVFCPVGKKDPSDNVCWCVCSECKDRFIGDIGAAEE